MSVNSSKCLAIPKAKYNLAYFVSLIKGNLILLPIQKGYFTFKQFAVKQEQTTLKVCTESCLFGALIDLVKAKTVLDIGTGTGLLPLMLAQKFPDAHFTALEIDPAATEEANFNFENSPWGNRLSAIEGNVIDYQPVNLFDVIICNPPFFPDHLLGPDPKKNAALHTTSLSFKELAFSVNRLSLENASFWCLLPSYQMTQLSEELAAFGWFPLQQFFIHNSLEKPVFRVVSQFIRGNSFTQPSSTTLSIRNSQNEYTPEFTALLQPYYLHL